MSYLDVRNQVANSRLKSRDFKIQITVLVMCQKTENSKEATNQKKQARKKVWMKHFKVKMTGICYVWVLKGYQIADCVLDSLKTF